MNRRRFAAGNFIYINDQSPPGAVNNLAGKIKHGQEVYLSDPMFVCEREMGGKKEGATGAKKIQRPLKTHRQGKYKGSHLR